MGFTDKQIRALHRRVTQRHIRSRVSDGKEFTYVEGWFAIAEANRIFGFDGWDRETVEAKCVQAREVRGSPSVLYTARVRITVRAGERSIVRDGHGTGEGRGSHLAEAHDLALKAAETDATKRALVTFGKAFGLSLYSDRSRRPASLETQVTRGREAVSTFPVPTDADEPARPIDPPSPANGSRPTLQVGVSRAPLSANGKSEPVSLAAEDSRQPMMPNGSAIPAPSATSQRHRTAIHNRAPSPRVDASKLRGRIDKSMLVLSEPRRVRDKEHLRYVAAQPCVLCGRVPGDAHHIRFAQPKAFGAKVSDEFTVPLCRDHHRELHNSGNERSWWHDMGVDPLPIARRLWEESHGGNKPEDGGNDAGSTQQTMASPVPAVATPELVGADPDHRQD